MLKLRYAKRGESVLRRSGGGRRSRRWSELASCPRLLSGYYQKGRGITWSKSPSLIQLASATSPSLTWQQFLRIVLKGHETMKLMTTRSGCTEDFRSRENRPHLDEISLHFLHSTRFGHRSLRLDESNASGLASRPICERPGVAPSA